MNAKQATFVREYLVDLNATQAAIRAGYSRKTAKVQGSRLLTNADVAAAVESGIAARAARVEVKADSVLRDVERLSLKAEAAGEYSAALRGRELQGKHLGLFAKDTPAAVGHSELTVIVQSLAEAPKGKK